MFKRNDDFFSDIIDTQTIFIDMENGLFYLLPLFANLVFKYIINGKTIDEIAEVMSTIPEIPSDYIERIKHVYEKLIEYKLIVDSDVPDTIPEPELTDLIIQELQESDFAYVVEPSADVAKLLLDDPIHDVSLDGWTPVVK